MKGIGSQKLKNFIIIRGDVVLKYGFKNYKKLVLDSKTLLYYQTGVKSSYKFIQEAADNFRIECENPFYPLFYYQNKHFLFLTPDHSLLNKVDISADINYSAIIEFIIFNTPLKSNTFDNNEKRFFGIREVIINLNEISFSFFEDKPEQKSIQEIFNDNVELIIDGSISDKHGLFLSGGNESRINAAISNYFKLDRIFITWGHPGNRETTIASKLARKRKTDHFNIRPIATDLPYKEYLEKTGYLSNMQYAYRYQAVKTVCEQYSVNNIWTGWGEINGFVKINSPTEFFNTTFWNFLKFQTIQNKYWDEDFLASSSITYPDLLFSADKAELNHSLFSFFQKEIAPRIYGQVLSAESTICNVIAPWFSSKIYEAVYNEQIRDNKLYLNRSHRVKWKNNLYYRLIKKYDPGLNYYKNSKNYYPFLFSDSLKYFGLPAAFLLSRLNPKKDMLFDPIEDKNFMMEELKKCLESGKQIFNNDEIHNAIITSDKWTGPEILELFKVIQINWFLTSIGK